MLLYRRSRFYYFLLTLIGLSWRGSTLRVSYNDDGFIVMERKRFYKKLFLVIKTLAKNHYMK